MLGMKHHRIHGCNPKPLIKLSQERFALLQFPNKSPDTFALGIALQFFIVYFLQSVFGRFIAFHQRWLNGLFMVVPPFPGNGKRIPRQFTAPALFCRLEEGQPFGVGLL